MDLEEEYKDSIKKHGSIKAILKFFDILPEVVAHDASFFHLEVVLGVARKERDGNLFTFALVEMCKKAQTAAEFIKLFEESSKVFEERDTLNFDEEAIIQAFGNRAEDFIMHGRSERQ